MPVRPTTGLWTKVEVLRPSTLWRSGIATKLIDRFEDRMALAFVFSLDGLKAGDYTLLLSVHDKLGQTDVSETARFQVSPADAGAVALKSDQN